MKKIRTFLLCFFMILFCMIPAKDAQAATTAKKLFSVVFNDGFTSQTIPVYLYTSGSTSYVAAKKTLRVISAYAGSDTAKISIKGKTSTYKNNFKSISYKKAVALDSSVNMAFSVKLKNNTRKYFVIQVNRPAMPEISSLTATPDSSTGFTTGDNNKLKVKLQFSAASPLKAYYKITNSSGKVVYKKVLGSRKSGTYTSYWDGKPSAGNAAGLATTAYVPAGSYKLTGYLQYKVGSKSKYIKNTVQLTVKTAQTATNSTTQNNASSGQTVTAASWSWNVVLTGDDNVDYLAEQICQQILTNGMSEIQRAKAIYTWIGNNMTHAGMGAKVDSNIDGAKEYGKQMDALIAQGKASVNNVDNYFGSSSGMQATRIGWAKRALVHKTGDCLFMALTYTVLGRHAGLTIDILENNAKIAKHHFWNVVKIGNSYYMADADVVTYSAGINSYGCFLRGTTYMYASNSQYQAVFANKKYAISKSVSATDCPGR